MAKQIITGRAFIPEDGKAYEVHFGKISYRGQEGFASANITVNGSDWLDNDTGTLLDPELRSYVVQAFREL
jgi:hypothetical protein